MSSPTFAYARFRTASGKYLGVLDAGPLNASFATPEPNTRFILVNRDGGALRGGATVNLLSFSGQWVAAEDGGSSILNANRQLALEWEQFTLVRGTDPADTGEIADQGVVCLRAFDGTFLLADSIVSGSLLADGMNATPAHVFTVELDTNFDAHMPSTGRDPPWPVSFFVDAVRRYLTPVGGIERLNATRSHESGNPLLGAKDDDEFVFDIPNNEGFERAEVEILANRRGGARVSALPPVGASGTGVRLKVHWWYDGASPREGNGQVKYRLKVFAVRGRVIPAATVAIFKDGSPQLLRGFGYLDREREKLTLPSTPMLIASIDKHVTAVALEIWMARNRGTVRKHTPFFPFLRGLGVQPAGGHLDDPRVDLITFQHLLEGTSGLGNIPDSLATAEEVASFAMAHGLVNAPGTVRQYPNLENDLLRFAMLKHRGGRDGFLRFLRDEVFGPLGSKDVGLLSDDPARPNPREPYYLGGEHRIPDKHLLITASAEALGRLFSRYRQSDGRPIGRDNPLISAIQVTRLPTQAGVQVRQVLRVNCGGPALTLRGETWAADDGPLPENAWSASVSDPIDATDDDALYQSCRYGALRYHFPVPAGVYEVKLKFAENWLSNPGERVFNVVINDDTVLAAFDILRETGVPRRALDKTFRVVVDASEGITIATPPSWGGETWYGGFGGTTAMVEQMFGPGIVNVALFNTQVEAAEIEWILKADALIGTNWP